MEPSGARERGTGRAGGVVRSKNIMDGDDDPASASQVSLSTSQLRSCHSRIVGGSPIPTGGGPRETAGHFHQ